MTIKPLYQHTKSFENHTHTYITGNNKPKLIADIGLLRKRLLIETKINFIHLHNIINLLITYSKMQK